MKGIIIKSSLIKSAVKSDSGTVFFFSPRESERELKVGDKVSFLPVESNNLNKCKNIKKL